MAATTQDKVLVEAIGSSEGHISLAKQAFLVVVGILALSVCAKIQVPLWPSPVPIAMTTFAVMTLGATYGPRLGLVTILGYMLVGALGFDVFVGTSAEKNGIAYMLGGTGGYLLGYVLATMVLGFAARRGLDRSPVGMIGAMLVGSVLIYVPGILWLHQFTTGWTQTFDWGLWPFLIGDAMKIALAAMLVPAVWKLVEKFQK